MIMRSNMMSPRVNRLLDKELEGGMTQILVIMGNGNSSSNHSSEDEEEEEGG